MLSYIEVLGKRVFDKSKTFDESISPLPWEELDPEYRRLFLFYGAMVLIRGSNTSSTDVHNAWAAWQAATMPDHKSLLPFMYLTDQVKDLDIPYRDAIREVARETFA